MAIGTDPVALVTGASSGIGRAAARELVRVGLIVYGTTRMAARRETQDGVAFAALDVTDDESVADADGPASTTVARAGISRGCSRSRRAPLAILHRKAAGEAGAVACRPS